MSDIVEGSISMLRFSTALVVSFAGARVFISWRRCFSRNPGLSAVRPDTVGSGDAGQRDFAGGGHELFSRASFPRRE